MLTTGEVTELQVTRLSASQGGAATPQSIENALLEETHNPDKNTGAGLLFTMAHWLTHNGFLIYGGFVRDYVLRAVWHEGMDLDVLLPTGQSAVRAKLRIIDMLEGAEGLRYIGEGKSSKRVMELLFYHEEVRCEEPFRIQLVDSILRQKDSRTDFVANAAQLRNGKVEFMRGSCGEENITLSDVRADIRNMRMVAVKRIEGDKYMADRKEKFEKRGWKVIS